MKNTEHTLQGHNYQLRLQLPNVGMQLFKGARECTPVSESSFCMVMGIYSLLSSLILLWSHDLLSLL